MRKANFHCVEFIGAVILQCCKETSLNTYVKRPLLEERGEHLQREVTQCERRRAQRNGLFL